MNFDIMHDPTAWVLISFVIFVALAYKFGRATVIKSLDDKIASIRTEIAQAEHLRAEAQALLADYQMKQTNALSEAQTILANAQAQANDLRSRADSELNETIARRETMMQDRIKRMEADAMEDIRRYAANLAISATAEIIAQKMNEQSAQQLADASIRKVAENLN